METPENDHALANKPLGLYIQPRVWKPIPLLLLSPFVKLQRPIRCNVRLLVCLKLFHACAEPRIVVSQIVRTGA